MTEPISRNDFERGLARLCEDIKEHTTLTVKPIIEKQNEHHKTLYDHESGLKDRLTVMETRREEEEKNFKKNMVLFKTLGGTGFVAFLAQCWQMLFGSHR